MGATKLDIAMHQRNYKEIAITSNTPGTVTWVLKRSVNGEELARKDGISLTDGAFVVTILAEDTDGLVGSYYHEAVLVTQDSKSFTLVYGFISVLPSGV